MQDAGTAAVTVAAIKIAGAGGGAVGTADANIGVNGAMLGVQVVTHMLLMRLIACYRRPDRLERQKTHQQDGDDAAHGVMVSVRLIQGCRVLRR